MRLSVCDYAHWWLGCPASTYSAVSSLSVRGRCSKRNQQLHCTFPSTFCAFFVDVASRALFPGELHVWFALCRTRQGGGKAGGHA